MLIPYTLLSCPTKKSPHGIRNDLNLNLTGEGLQEAPGLVLVATVQGEQQEARQPRSEAQVLGSPHTPHITILSRYCHTLSHYVTL